MRSWGALAFLAAAACAGKAALATDAGEPPDAGLDAGPSDGGGDAGATSPDGGDGGPFVEAPHLPLPQLVFHNGTAYAQPKLVTVTWSGFTFEPDVQTFGDGLVTSQWLTTVDSEYGFQSATHLMKVSLTPALPASLTDADLQAVLAANIANGTLPSPASNPELVFLVYIPPGVTLDASAVTKSGALCGAYYGYHWYGTDDAGTKFPYAISGDCDGNLGSITALASHEFLEVMQDAYNDGWYIDPPATDDWILYEGFETADMCQFMPYVTEFGYTLERGWSNAAAAAGQAPCLPIPSTDVPYSDVTPASGSILVVDAGTTVQVTLTGWSVASRAAWPINVADFPLASFLTSPQLGVAMLNNDQTVTLTLGVPAGTDAGLLGSAVVYSGSSNGRFWPITLQAR